MISYVIKKKRRQATSKKYQTHLVLLTRIYALSTRNELENR